jgi:hypothetical protein
LGADHLIQEEEQRKKDHVFHGVDFFDAQRKQF